MLMVKAGQVLCLLARLVVSGLDVQVCAGFCIWMYRFLLSFCVWRMWFRFQVL